VADETTTAAVLSERIRAVAEGNRSAKTYVTQFFREANAGEHVYIASCKGGTQQIFNRLHQDEVQRGKDLAILYVKPDDDVDNLIEYVKGAFRGEKGEPRIPAGPIAIAQQNDEGIWIIHDIVAKRDTRATQLVHELYEDVQLHNPFGDLQPKLPDGANAFQVVLDEGAEDLDAMESFIFGGDAAGQPQAGDVVIFVTNEETPMVIGLGQVDRVMQSGGSNVAVLRHVDVVEPGIALAGFPQ
jgi:hypothetical protein